MSATIQLINVTENELVELFSERIKKEVEEIKKSFQPKEPETYMTRNEVTEYLHINLSTLYHWTKKGKLQAYGIGNRVYYKRSDVEAAFKPL